jgi:hypothetical protein
MRLVFAFLIFSSLSGVASAHTFYSNPGATNNLRYQAGGRPRVGGQPAVPVPRVEAPADAQGLLSVDEMRTLLKGNSSYGFVVSGEEPYREYYAPNGKIRGKFKPGRWSIEDGKFCATYPNLKPWCSVVRRLPNGAYAWEVEGTIVGYMKVRSGNPFEF